MKISHKLGIRMDGSQFLWLWWFTAFTAKNHSPQTFQPAVYDLYFLNLYYNLCLSNHGYILDFKVFCDLFKPSQKSIYSVDLTVVCYLSYVGDDFSQIFCDRGWLWLGIWHHNNLNQRQKRNLRSIFFQECHTRRSRGSKRSTIRWNIFSGSNEMFF